VGASPRAAARRDGHDLADRVAGLLVLLFGQRPGKISGLTTDSVGLDGGLTSLTLGTTPIRVPEPLATLLHQLVRQRRQITRVPVGGPGPWLFPGLHPGRPVLPATISRRLARIGVDTVTGRAGALLQLAGELPPTVLADLLGLRPKTAVAWSQLPGAPGAAPPSATSRADPRAGSSGNACAGQADFTGRARWNGRRGVAWRRAGWAGR
jgi:hypothetical protein